MILKKIINNSICGVTGYISSQDDLDLLEQYILYNLPVLKEFKQVIVATNYSSGRSYPSYQTQNKKLWKKYFPDCIILDSVVNRGHNHGYCDLENLIFDYCKENNIEWLCKISNDVIFEESILNKEIDEADFYYLNGFSYETLYKLRWDYSLLYTQYFYPQGNFYFINVSKIDYLNNKKFLDETYKYIQTIPDYNGKIWEYIKGWSCEEFLGNCVKRNNLSKFYLLDEVTHNKLCDVVKFYQIGDPSHKNIMINGVCHFQFPNEPIIKI
jgi:hypothetical protein